MRVQWLALQWRCSEGCSGVAVGCSAVAVWLQRTEQRGRRRVVILGGDDEDGVGVLVRVRMRVRVGAMG